MPANKAEESPSSKTSNVIKDPIFCEGIEIIIVLTIFPELMRFVHWLSVCRFLKIYFRIKRN
jgi:hypothetical protein